MRGTLICLLTLFAASAHAEQWLVRSLSVSVYETNADGKSWDPSGGAPDLTLTLIVDGQEAARCVIKDRTRGQCTPNTPLETGPDPKIELVVVDADLGRDDPVGTAVAAGPIGPGIHSLAPRGRVRQASIELAMPGVPAPVSATRRSSKATSAESRAPPSAGRRAAERSGDPGPSPDSSPSPAWLGWLLGLVIGGLIGGVLVRVVSATSGRLALGAVAVVAGLGVAVSLVFEYLSASVAVVALQWTLGAIAAVLGGAGALGSDHRRLSLFVLAGGLLVFVGPVMIYGAIGVLLIAVALAFLQS